MPTPMILEKKAGEQIWSLIILDQSSNPSGGRLSKYHECLESYRTSLWPIAQKHPSYPHPPEGIKSFLFAPSWRDIQQYYFTIIFNTCLMKPHRAIPFGFYILFSPKEKMKSVKKKLKV